MACNSNVQLSQESARYKVMMVDFLEMMKKVMTCQNIDVTVLTSEMEDIPDFDRGIRRMLLQPGEKQHFMEWIYENGCEGVAYYLQDYFETEYCIFLIPEAERAYGEYIILGPYRDSYIDDIRLNDLIEAKEIPNDYRDELSEYYHAVPVVARIGPWRELCTSMVQMLYGPGAQIRVEYMQRRSLEGDFLQEENNGVLSADMIEKRYAVEGELLRAVSSGNMEEALQVLSHLGQYQIAERFKDPERNLRNLLIVASTLFRKAAEQACVHPAHIDKLSTQIAKQIELVNNKAEHDRMMNEMVRKYCLLVRNYSLLGHSPVIQKVVNHINLNLTTDLSLKRLSEEYSVNASYLSALFKKEMGVTITDYINQQRIHRSIRLLNSTNMQIQDIAAECGIFDVNYFRRLFKKIIGRTPTEYAKEIRRHG